MPKPDPIVMALTRRRKALGLTQQQVAVRMGYSPGAHSQITRWETGRKSPFLASLLRWADALGCDLALTVRREAAGG